MLTPTQIVLNFMGECETGKSEMKAAFRSYFNPTGIWDNVGRVTTVGPEAAIALMEKFEKDAGVVTWRSEFLTMAEQGNKVLMERIDYMIDATGVEKLPCRIMGIFEIEDGKITAWRDYFDTTNFPQKDR